MNEDLTEIKSDIKQLKIDVADLVLRAQYKKELKADLLSWLRIGALLIPVVMVIIGYMSYEAGLYKPIPQQMEQK